MSDGKTTMQNALLPMQSQHHSSAILQSRKKPEVAPFSEKGLHNYSAYQSQTGVVGGNPVLMQ
jgi:hypothetical protein